MSMRVTSDRSMTVREVVVASGKGGTGKTSIAASLAVLAGRVVVADCDVDAADLHLVLNPTIRQRTPFYAGHEAWVRPEACTGCGVCVDECRSGAIVASNGKVVVEPLLCEGCGLCVRLCPEEAIGFPERRCGEWYRSETRVGPMVHARLEPGGESSGKLVTLVRREARRLASEGGYELILVDGPPGIGCPVIATLSGATELLAVTEPTPSGIADLERLLVLADHFQVPAAVCVNKFDLNLDLTAAVGELARARRVPVVGRVSYDPRVTAAQVAGRSVVEEGGQAAQEIGELWRKLERGGGFHVIS
jgi:MinD superfamily P-loop ATPase